MFLVTIENRADFNKVVKQFLVEDRQRAYYLADYHLMRIQDAAEDKWDRFEFNVTEIEVLE